MSYGVKWRLEYTDELSRDKRIDILKKDYTGDIQTVTGATHSPVHISMQNQGDEKFETLKGTEIEVKLFSEVPFNDIFENFSTDTFYVIGTEPTKDPDLDNTARIQKVTFDSSGNLTYGNKFDFSSTIYKLPVGGGHEDTRHLSVGKNGNVLAAASGGYNSNLDTLHVHLFDSNLARISSLAMDDLGVGTVNDSDQRAYFGEDSNIYVTQTAESQVRVRKYDSSLNHIWDSNWFTFTIAAGFPARHPSLIFFGGKVILHAQASEDETGYGLISIDSSDGSQIKRVDNVGSYINTQCVLLNRFSFDKFVVAYGNGFTQEEEMLVYDSDLNFINTVNLSAMGRVLIFTNSTSVNYEFAVQGSFDENLIIGSRLRQRIVKINPLTSELIWAKTYLETNRHMSIVGKDKMLCGLNIVGESNLGLVLFNTSSGNSVFKNTDIWDDAEIIPNIRAVAMPYEGWQLDYFNGIDFSEIAEGSDTDYKIEVYEDDGL